MAVVVVILFLAIVWFIRTVNTAASGDPKGSFLGEGILASGCGCVVLATILLAIAALMAVAGPIILVIAAVVAAVALLLKSK